ncbi:MAG: hypothetical protein AAFX85_12780 [Pseudomonadota bacterium]
MVRQLKSVESREAIFGEALYEGALGRMSGTGQITRTQLEQDGKT